MTPEQEVLSLVAKTVFHLNGKFLAVAEDLADPVGLTAARWQVLGTILVAPMTVADIGRELGVTRQSVQRIADILVEQGLAIYEPNPSHRRAKLLVPTDQGRELVGRIATITGARLLVDLRPRVRVRIHAIADLREAIRRVRRAAVVEP